MKNLILGLKAGGNTIENEIFFDTLKFKPQMSLNEIKQRAKEKRINLRYYEDGGVSLDQHFPNIPLIVSFILDRNFVGRDDE